MCRQDIYIYIFIYLFIYTTFYWFVISALPVSVCLILIGSSVLILLILLKGFVFFYSYQAIHRLESQYVQIRPCVRVIFLNFAAEVCCPSHMHFLPLKPCLRSPFHMLI
jgi:energy-coupling factor transporter transmembrane protein EcfT